MPGEPRTEAGRRLLTAAWNPRPLLPAILAIEDEAASPVPAPTLDVERLREAAEKLLAAIADHDEANIHGWSTALAAALRVAPPSEPGEIDAERLAAAIANTPHSSSFVEQISGRRLKWSDLDERAKGHTRHEATMIAAEYDRLASSSETGTVTE